MAGSLFCKRAFRGIACATARLHLFAFGRLDAVFLVEALDAACGINELLLAGKEGMAGRTDFNLDILYRRTGLDDIAARTGNGGEFVFGMDTLFHVFPPDASVDQMSENRPGRRRLTIYEQAVLSQYPDMACSWT